MEEAEKSGSGSSAEVSVRRVNGTKIYLVKLPPGRLTDNYVITKIQDHLLEMINKSRTAQFVVDLHDVTLMSSEMLGVLVSLQKSAKRKKGFIHLARPTLGVSRIFEAIKLHKTVKIYASIEKAVKST